MMRRLTLLGVIVAAACASPSPAPFPDVEPGRVIRVDLGSAPVPVPLGGMVARFRPRAGAQFESVDTSVVRVTDDGRTLVGVGWGLTPVRVLSSEQADSIWVLVRPAGRFDYGGSLDYSVESLPRGAFVTEEPIVSVHGFVDFGDADGGVRVQTGRCRGVIPMEDIHRGEATSCGLTFSGDDIHIAVTRGGMVRYEYRVRTNRCVQTDPEGVCVEYDTDVREGARGVLMRGILPLVRR